MCCGTFYLLCPGERTDFLSLPPVIAVGAFLHVREGGEHMLFYTCKSEQHVAGLQIQRLGTTWNGGKNHSMPKRSSYTAVHTCVYCAIWSETSTQHPNLPLTSPSRLHLRRDRISNEEPTSTDIDSQHSPNMPDRPPRGRPSGMLPSTTRLTSSSIFQLIPNKPHCVSVSPGGTQRGRRRPTAAGR